MVTYQDSVEKLSGPCLIKAGAGTGKTYTIVKKVAKLIKTNFCTSAEILCLTFSNKATINLREEIEKELNKSSDITIKTFHSFCASILREFGFLIDVSPDFNILYPEDATVMIYKDLATSSSNAKLYTNSISKAKDLGISKEEMESYVKNIKNKFPSEINDLDLYANDLDVEFKLIHLKKQDTKDQKQEINARIFFLKDFLEDYNLYTKYSDFIKVWNNYDQLKSQKNYLDYSDLNFLVLKLFDIHGSQEISKKYKYIFIDEFQDTNKIQFDLINKLTQDHKNITVVGDPNQSVYGFRGSFKSCFEEFKKTFNLEDSDIVALDKSHRSPNTILRTAFSLIKNNYLENPDDCMIIKNNDNIEGAKVKVIELKNGAEEARKISEIVEMEIENGTALKEICILYRTHAQGILIQQALEYKNIPIITAGKINLLQKEEIRTVIAYLSILNNLQKRTGTGEQSWWNLFHFKNALTPEDAIKLARYLKKHRNEKLSIDYIALLKIAEIDISSAGKKIIKRIIEKLEEIMSVKNKILPELILDIYELTGLNRKFNHSRNSRNIEGLMNLKYFYDVAFKFYNIHGEDLESFIDYLEILDDVDVEVEAAKIIDDNAIRLMTIHTVKGLQFEKVIVTNLSENRFPIRRTEKNAPLIPKELNPDIKLHLKDKNIDIDNLKAIKEYEVATFKCEERRLCYVAFTRAKKELVITYAKSYNNKEGSSESEFLKEINYKENPDIEFMQDVEEKSTFFAPYSKFEQYKGLLKNQIIESLDSDNFIVLLSRLIVYHTVREGEIQKYDVDLNNLVDKKELESHITNYHKKKSGLTFDKSNFTFSPTDLSVYNDCPKKYELQHILQMPGRGEFKWSAASVGSFLHEVLEIGVKELFNLKEQFIAKAEQMSKEEKWHEVDLKDINNLIEIFWARHNGRYNDKTLTEKWIEVELEGFKFKGKVDRIDFINETDIEIIDYKTGNKVKPEDRALQLGFYAIATKKQLNLNTKKITLEMLRLKTPLVGVLIEDNVKFPGNNLGFKISEVEKELVDTAKAIMHDYEHEFLPVKEDNPCRYCGYKLYCPKWEEK